jgi:hypothetical protein
MRLRANLFVVLCSVVLPACGDDVARWSEDVKLHDGRVIKLERRAVIGGSGFPTSHRGEVKRWELCYEPLKIYWKSKYFRPSSFELQGTNAYVKVLLQNCTTCTIAKFPQDSSVYLAYRNHRWERIESSEFPGSAWRNLLEDTNKIFDPRDSSKDLKGHYALDRKRTEDLFPEDTDKGKSRAGIQRSLCSSEECRLGVETDYAFDFEAKPDGLFCR